MNLRRFAGQAALFIAAVSFKAHAQPPVPIQNVPDPSKLTASQALEVEVSRFTTDGLFHPPFNGMTESSFFFSSIARATAKSPSR